MKLMNILSEILQLSDLRNIEMYGGKIVDEIESGPYSMALIIFPSGEYQIGLTSFDNNFTTPEHQRDNKNLLRNKKKIKQNFNVVVDKIREWLNKYKRIRIGSFNIRKVKRYYELLKSAGLNCHNLTLTSLSGSFTISQKSPNEEY